MKVEHRTTITLVLTGLLAIGAASATARWSYESTLEPHLVAVARENRDDEIPAKLHAYLDSRTASSDLLFQLAFSGLAAALALRLSSRQEALATNHAYAFAIGLLLGSIFSAFLFRELLAQSLEGNPMDAFGNGLRYAVALQFWYLFVSMILLSVVLLGRRPPKGATAIFALTVLVFSSETRAVAAGAPTELEQCVVAWTLEREVLLQSPSVEDATVLAERLAARSQIALVSLSASERCDFVTAMLDRIRFEAIAGGASSGALSSGVAEILRAARASTVNPTFEAGELLRELLSAAQFWRTPAATLLITSRIGELSVFVTPRRGRQGRPWRGYTAMMVRVPAGSYEVSASAKGEVVERRVIEVRDGDQLRIEFGPEP